MGKAGGRDAGVRKRSGRSGEISKELARLLEGDGDRRLAEDILATAHYADIAEVLEAVEGDDSRRWILGKLDDEEAALVVGELPPDLQIVILKLLDSGRVRSVLDKMSSDDIADLLGEAGTEEAKRILKLLEKEEAEEVTELLTYREDSAGGIMTTEFLALSENMTAEETIAKMRQLAPDAETVYYLYVVDDDEKLVGVLSLRELIVAQPGALLKDIMRRNVVSVNVATDREEVARVIRKYDLLAVPVVDDAGRIHGIVTFDDAMDVVEEETTEDIYKMAGAGQTAGVDELRSAWARASKRLPWLVFLLFGDFLSANVIKGFTVTLESFVALAYFIPILMDMGGNVGTQSFAIVVRGLATGEVDKRELFRAACREARVGVVVGAICGLLVAGIALLWQRSPTLGLVVGGSLGLTLVVAAVVGAMIPLVMENIGVDSAVASGPFITTAIDVLALLIYFGLATYFMHRLAPGG